MLYYFTFMYTYIYIHIQTYLIFIVLCFIALHRYWGVFVVVFFNSEGLWQLCTGAKLLVPFFQQYLLTLCLCVTFWVFCFVLFCFCFLFFVLFCFVCLLLFRAALAAYGGSQARGQIRAVAAGLHHRSQQRQILNPLSKARDRTHNSMVPSWIHFWCATDRNAIFW